MADDSEEQAEAQDPAATDAESDAVTSLLGDVAGGLDQEEIDSLLGFGDEEEEGANLTGLEVVLNSTLVAYERLPMLEVVYDRLMRMMTTSLRNFTSENVDVLLDNVTSIRFGDYLNAVPLPAILGVFKAEEWDNYGLIYVDGNLIYSVVDTLLGGRRGTAPLRIEGRAYTTIERGLVERMLHVVLNDLSNAFEPLSKVHFKFERLETNPRFARIARSGNAVIVSKLRIDMEDRGGKIELLLPYATLEPVRELLLQMFLGEKFDRDSIWEEHLATELWETDVNISAVLDQQVMMLGDIMELEVGSHISLNASPDSEIELRCGGVPMFSGSMGRRGKRIAVRIKNAFGEGVAGE